MSYKNIVGWFSDANVDFYRELASKINNGIIVEVGSFAGRSAISIGDICRENNNKLYCVDHWEGSPEYLPGHKYYHLLKQRLVDAGYPYIYETFLENIKKENLENILIPMKMPSEEASSKFTLPIDLVFIDANHTFDAVVQDIKTWYPHIKSGGVMAGHDYDTNWKDVMNAVNYCFDKVGNSGNIWFKEKE